MEILTVEGPFAIVCFAYVESHFVLCASEISQAIIVRLPFKQFIDTFRVAIVRSIM